PASHQPGALTPLLMPQQAHVLLSIICTKLTLLIISCSITLTVLTTDGLVFISSSSCRTCVCVCVLLLSFFCSSFPQTKCPLTLMPIATVSPAIGALRMC